MKGLLFSFLIQALYLFNSINCDSLLWNVQGNVEYTYNDILSKSDQIPVVVFMHPNFDISQFSRQANVYGTKNDGGRLKNLKKWIDRSEGYVVKSEALSSQLLQYFDTTEYDSNNPPVDSDLSVLLVNVIDWDDLDSKAEEVRRLFKGKKYVAILTTVAQYRKKRDNGDSTTTAPPPSDVNATFIEIDDCKLYAEGIYFLTKVTNLTTKSTGTCKVTLDNNPDYSSSSEICGNFTGSIVLSWSGQNFLSDASGCNGLGSLDSISITLDFDINNHTDTWFVSSVFMTASGSMIPNQQFQETLYSYKNSSWEFNYISGSQYFSYACSEPPPIFQADTVPSADGKANLQFGLGFKNFQFQPFAALHNTTGSEMTDNVDDCTPFFNIYIWMFILCMLLLVSIVLCGMTMMCSLKTMDRFDDMRAKTINVNVVN